MLGSSVGPSCPWFQERLLLWPSAPFSPFASLCFSLYETRSLSVKPSCAVMKLIVDQGLRPRLLNKSPEPATRAANSPIFPLSPFQNDRAVSRNLSFHSLHPGGKRPT